MLFFRFAGVLLIVACAAHAQEGPRVIVAPLQVIETDPVQVRGTGFTPNFRVVSHLRRPDGTDYEVIWFHTNEQGEFSHTIDTLLLDPGTFELWVIDDATKKSSNIARFAVDFQSQVPAPVEVQQIVQQYVGVWRGQGARNAPSTVIVAITGRNSAVAGVIAFPNLECGGILTFRAVRVDSVEFFQTSNYGVDRCGAGGALHLKLQPDGAVALSGTATGVLTRLKE